MVMNPLFRMYTASVVIVTFPGFHSINQSNQNCYNVVSYKKCLQMIGGTSVSLVLWQKSVWEADDCISEGNMFQRMDAATAGKRTPADGSQTICRNLQPDICR